MTESQAPGYVLTDPRPIAASAPYSFFLPSADEIAAISPGDFVKLLFDYSHQIEKWAGERMWVAVEAVEGNALRGKLDNDPDEPTSPLKAGDAIAFERYHILDIDWINPDAAPQAVPKRQYWERCLVDACVLDGTEPVEFIYREEPDMQQEGDSFSDSGWRIRGRMGSTTDEELEARKIEYIAIAKVLNRDDSWLGLIDAPVGSAFMRDFETNEYVSQIVRMLGFRPAKAPAPPRSNRSLRPPHRRARTDSPP